MATQEPSIADIVKVAIHDAQELVRSEIALAKVELRGEIRRVGTGAALLAAAAVSALIGVIFLLTAIAWAIPEGLGWPAWTGFALVTVVVLIAAAAMYFAGRARLANGRRMPHTVDTLKENVQWMRARTS